MRTAADIKDVTRELDEFTLGQLKQIPVLPAGAHLQQGATYLDLNSSDCRPFTAMGSMVTSDDNFYVPRSHVPYQLWNRLVGLKSARRTR